MIIKLYSTKRGEFHFIENIPPKAANLKLPGAKCKIATTIDDNSFFLFQEFEEDGIKVRFCNFFSREKDSIILLTDPMTTFRFAYSRSHHFHLPHLTKLQFHERSYNLFHAPLFSAEFSIGPNELYVFWDIILPIEYLQLFEQEFPVLSDFLKKVLTNLPAKLSLHNHVATTEIMRWADELIQWNYTEIGKRKKLSAIVHQLLLHSFQSIKQKPDNTAVKLNQQDIEKIYKIADLLYHTDRKYTLQELSEKFKISTYKLDKGFKQIYNHSVLHHRLEEKMRLALRLVHDKQYNIKQVASMLDYYPQNFVRAFKNRFGYTPGRNAQKS